MNWHRKGYVRVPSLKDVKIGDKIKVVTECCTWEEIVVRLDYDRNRVECETIGAFAYHTPVEGAQYYIYK